MSKQSFTAIHHTSQKAPDPAISRTGALPNVRTQSLFGDVNIFQIPQK